MKNNCIVFCIVLLIKFDSLPAAWIVDLLIFHKWIVIACTRCSKVNVLLLFSENNTVVRIYLKQRSTVCMFLRIELNT